MNNNLPEILKLVSSPAIPAGSSSAEEKIEQENNYFIEQQAPLKTAQAQENEEYLDAINEVQEIDKLEIEVDYEQLVIEQYEKELELAKQMLDEQEEKDGFVNDLFNGIKELTGLGVSKSEVYDAIEKQESVLEVLKQAQISGNFKEVYEEVTGKKYDEEKLLTCHQAEVELESLQSGFDEILNSDIDDEAKQEKINGLLLNYQNESGISYEELVNQYQELSSEYLGSSNELTNVLNDYINSQEGFIKKTANFAQIGGMGLMIAGGIACFIPGGAVIGAGMLKAGQVLSMAGTFGDNALEAVDLMTNEKKFKDEKDEYSSLAKETLTEGALFAVGYGAGFAAGKAGGYVMDKTGKAFLSKATDTAVDTTISLAGDALITGEVDYSSEGISQIIAAFTGSATARVGKMNLETPSNALKNPNKGIEIWDRNGSFKISKDAINGGIKAGEIKVDTDSNIDKTSLGAFADTYDRLHYQKLDYLNKNYPDLDTSSFKKLMSSFKTPQEMQLYADDIARWRSQEADLRSFTNDMETFGKADVDETQKRIAEALGLPVEKVQARAKGTESIYDKLTRKVLKGAEISSLEQAIPKVDDLVGTRVTLDDVSQDEINKIVKNLCSSIERGKVVITELHNYSKDSQKYFSDENITSLKQASTKVGNEIKILEQEQTSASGYVSAQMNIRYKDPATGELGARGELQIRGKYMDKYAEIEHIPYDISKGKNIGKNHPVLEEHFKPVDTAVNKMKRAGLTGIYDDYILESYKYINDFEHGKITGDFELPKFPQKLKGYEILSFESLDDIDKTAKAIKKKYNIT